MRAVNEACPEITILLTFSYRAGKRSEEQFFRVGNYELLIPFLDGALSVCTPETRFIDGWEYAYGYTKPHQFARANRIIKQDIPFWTADRSRYRHHFEAALGLWTDYEFRDFGWNQTDFSGNFHQPDQLTARLGQAASQVDQYVWLYSSKANWWTGENLPEAYIEAVRRAKRKVTSAGDLP